MTSNTPKTPLHFATLQLNRNLRKSVLRGHPWIYSEALQLIEKGKTQNESPHRTQIAKLLDSKKEFLAWGLYDLKSPLALRIVSLAKSFPNEDVFKEKVRKAWRLRKNLLQQDNNALRIINGEGDELPGWVADRYNQILVCQFDGDGMTEFWSTQSYLWPFLGELLDLEAVVFKKRKSQKSPEDISWLWKKDSKLEKKNLERILISENGRKFYVDLLHGQKTGFFLDQRDNRKYIENLAKDKSVANFFSYTGGFSIYAGAGQAQSVLSLDLSEKALELAQENWLLNDLPKNLHRTLSVDIYEYIKESKDQWDLVIVDPPSMTHSEDSKDRAIEMYKELFSQCIKRVAPGGDIVLSSCSSHVQFQDFYDLTIEAISQAKRRGRVLRFSGQGSDHPYPLVCPELRYLKFIHCALD